MDNTFATVVSMLPYPLIEFKTGLYPNEYRIKAAKPGDFSLNIIPNDAYHLVDLDPMAEGKSRRVMKVPTPALELANSIVNDYVSALLAVELPDTVPGLFAVSGDFKDKDEIKKAFYDKFKFFRDAQNRWFRNLTALADDVWAKTKSPLTISDLQRSAAKALDLKRDWINPPNPEEVNKCPICMNAINEGAVKCVACGFIFDKAKYDKLVGVGK